MSINNIGTLNTQYQGAWQSSTEDVVNNFSSIFENNLALSSASSPGANPWGSSRYVDDGKPKTAEQLKNKEVNERREEVKNLTDPTNYKQQREFEKINKLTNKVCDKSRGFWAQVGIDTLWALAGPIGPMVTPISKKTNQDNLDKLQKKLDKMSDAEFVAYQEYYYRQNGTTLIGALQQNEKGWFAANGGQGAIGEKYVDKVAERASKANDWYSGNNIDMKKLGKEAGKQEKAYNKEVEKADKKAAKEVEKEARKAEKEAA
ncbi:hypothetical protein tpqmel_0021 [Candidatus Gastranaerophilus sp. (ex Termes propinquus)]|nr:hypothetical protein tpqmel_0021 [Candidatus Gastranaerophilus sp. (ex Termes propinquus)]